MLEILLRDRPIIDGLFSRFFILFSFVVAGPCLNMISIYGRCFHIGFGHLEI